MNGLLCLSVGLAVIAIVTAGSFKFPDQPSASSSYSNDDANYRDYGSYNPRNNIRQPVAEQSEGRFLNIHGAPSSLFNRLTVTNNLQDDDIGDYDDSVVDTNQQQQSGITSPRPSLADAEDRRRHRRRKRPCVPYTPFFRNNNNNNNNYGNGYGRQAEQNQGRTFFSLLFNDYNIYGGQQQHTPQYDTYGGYPCYSLGGHQTQQPHRPHRPLYPGTGGLGDSGVSNDDPGTGNRPGGGPLGFFGPGGLFDVTSILNTWLGRPQGAVAGLPGANGGSGVLSEPTMPANDVKPVVEVNVQDTIQDVVQTAGGILGAIQGLFSQTPPQQSPLSDPNTPAAVAADDVALDPVVEAPQDDLIQPRPTKRPHKYHYQNKYHRSRYPYYY